MYPVSSTTLIRSTFLILILLGLAACGGGGGDNNPPPVDRSFTLLNQGFDDEARLVAPAVDGSGDIYVAGWFTHYNDKIAGHIMRFNSDGTADDAFATSSGFNNSIQAIATANDSSGDVYVGGWFSIYNGTPINRIARLNSDGTLDDSFVVGSGFSDFVDAIAPASDGSGDIYVGGNFGSYDGVAVPRIVRLNSDGSIDSAFDIGSGFNGVVRSIVPASDNSGDIYVGGNFTKYNGSTARYITRLNSDGSIDTGFATGSGFNSDVESAVSANDGSGDIYVGGYFTQYNGSTAKFITRLNSDGSIDTGFATGSGFNNIVLSIAPALDNSGDIYVAGNFTQYNGSAAKYITRLKSDGTIDSGFATGSGFDDRISKVFAGANGSAEVYILGAFASYNGKPSHSIIRLSSDGSVSQAYSENVAISEYIDVLIPAEDGSGDIYMGGYFNAYNGSIVNHIARVNSDGTLDTAFATGSGFDNEVLALALASDGSGDVYVGGGFSSYNGTAVNSIARVNSDGTLDDSFVIGSGFNGSVGAIAPASDGSGDIYVGGSFTSYDGVAVSRIVRLNSDGSIDATFDIGNGFNNYVISIVPASDNSGDIYVGGSFTSYNDTASNRIIRLNSDGTVDDTFVVGSGFNGNVNSMVLLGDGSLYLGGRFSSYNGSSVNSLIRLNSDGSVDSSFDIGTGIDDSVNTLSQANDGSGDLYVGGYFTSYNGSDSNNIVRLNSDGTLDTAFATGTGFNYDVYTLAPAVDGFGDIYVGGDFSRYQSTTALSVIALNPDGSID